MTRGASRVLGTVAAIWRYPVKSMKAEALATANVGWQGIAGDRRWAFIRPNMEHSGFPWLTIRQLPSLCRYEPRYQDPDNPERSETLVRTPNGREYLVTHPDLAAALGDGVRVMRQDRGVFDTMPLSLITTTSVASVGERTGMALNPLRFRPNLLVEPADDGAFPEDEWVGAVLRIGDMCFRVDKRDERCVTVNVDPETTERHDGVLRAIAQSHDACLGVYGTPVQPGLIRQGDAVILEG